MATKRPFVKSSDTKASAANSRVEVERMLTRYGAVGFSYAVNLEAGEIKIDFIVPDSAANGSPNVPVSLPVSIRRVYDSLYGQPKIYDYEIREWRYDPTGYDVKKLAQAERVAWRNLVLWIDAALSAASIGMQTITEAFFAHTMVVENDGRVGRMIDYVTKSGGALAPGVRALLPVSTEIRP